MSKFEVYKDKKGETRFRYRAKNNEIMFSSEGYAAKASAMSAIKSIMKNATTATIDDQTVAKPAAKPAAKKAAAKPAKAAAPKKAAAKPKAPAKPKAAKAPAAS